jgi:hypothetical protein
VVGEVNARDFSCVPAVRCQIQQAEEKLTIAAKELRKHGLADSADEIVGKVKWLRTWTGPGGVLDLYQSAEDWPNE